EAGGLEYAAHVELGRGDVDVASGRDSGLAPVEADLGRVRVGGRTKERDAAIEPPVVPRSRGIARHRHRKVEIADVRTGIVLLADEVPVALRGVIGDPRIEHAIRRSDVLKPASKGNLLSARTIFAVDRHELVHDGD